MSKLILEFETDLGSATINYSLVNSPPAEAWARRIRILQRVPVDPDTTSDAMRYHSYEHYCKELTDIIHWICQHTEFRPQHSKHYLPTQLVELHDLYLALAGDSRYDGCGEVYRFNTVIHACENTLAGHPLHEFTISWGKKEGIF